MKQIIEPDILEGAPLRKAPQNELGVVFLFAHLAKNFRIRVEEISPSFPDCIAYQKVGRGEKKIRIEFEYLASNFKQHGHDPKRCDYIVCWENDWVKAPKDLNIIELRREYGLGFNIWIVPSKNSYKEELDKYPTNTWSVPSQAHRDDLILFYLTKPHGYIAHIFKLQERAQFVKEAGWRPGSDYMASIKKVCTLKAPLYFEDLKSNRFLTQSGFVRGRMRGRRIVTEYWPHLYDLIIKRNPYLQKMLAKYSPERL